MCGQSLFVPCVTHSQLQASAMEAANQAGTPDPHAALLQMTLAFNDARVLEACGEWHSAEQRYMEAADAYPDCQLRLALLTKRRGDLEGALRWADKAEALPDLKADAQCIKGSFWGGLGAALGGLCEHGVCAVGGVVRGKVGHMSET